MVNILMISFVGILILSHVENSKASSEQVMEDGNFGFQSRNLNEPALDIVIVGFER